MDDMSAQDHDDITRKSFEQQVGLFSGDDALFARRPASTLAWLEPLDTSMVVLDVACGAAHASEVAAPHVRQVVGIDLTPALLAIGANRLRNAGITNVLLQEGHAAALPFVDASFDVVFCRTALHHFPDPEACIAEMARVCRPGGRVVLSDMIAPSAQVRDAFDELHRRIDPSHARALLKGEIAEFLGRAVGPLSYGETASIKLPIDVMLTDAADREAALTALQQDLDGKNPTGFEPVLTDDGIVVSFTATVVHATRT
jgi:ubiquinone/menaquinone biosynthesis C-methylase UbiE